MTGRELIKWIQDYNAEDLPFVVQYRDARGRFRGGKTLLIPCIAHASGDISNISKNESVYVDIDLADLDLNCVVV